MNIVIVITHIVHINIYCNFSKYYSLMMIIQYAVPCFANKIKVHVFRVFELNWSLQQQQKFFLSLSRALFETDIFLNWSWFYTFKIAHLCFQLAQ